MKLTRVIHMGGVQVFFATVAELLPDLTITVPVDGTPTDRCLMFVDAAAGEAHGFLFTEEQARELAETILAPKITVVRTFDGGMLS